MLYFFDGPVLRTHCWEDSEENKKPSTRRDLNLDPENGRGADAAHPGQHFSLPLGLPDLQYLDGVSGFDNDGNEAECQGHDGKEGKWDCLPKGVLQDELLILWALLRRVQESEGDQRQGVDSLHWGLDQPFDIVRVHHHLSKNFVSVYHLVLEF